MAKVLNTYIMYDRYENELARGTIREISERLGIDEFSVRKCGTPSHIKKYNNGRYNKVLVKEI